MDSGQYTNYPRPPVREINLSVIGVAWNMIIKNLMPFALCSLAALVAMAVPFGIGYVVSMGAAFASASNNDVGSAIGMQLVSTGIQLPFTILAYALAGPFAVSFVLMARKLLAGEAVSTDDIFSGFSKFVPAAIAGGVLMLGVTIGSYCCIVPGLLFGGLTMFTFPIIATKDVGPFEAIRESWGMLTGHLWMAGVAYFLASLVSSLGFCVCAIGLVVTLPILYVVEAILHRDFTEAPMAAEAPSA
ncbi:MAG: hypothetical protein KF884_01385 [Fimbriimonadaceae bacterium]|nr:hypothetical protein [Fimbriimonadaceae bacterium]QYK58748.1 MAG: hypothetical protein KF884_01385 [Fimbriimonadaceae bacterium]